jgi:trimethylamine:corrinoid methyltransferase-like protein
MRQLFSDSQLERMYQSAVRVLGQMGMRVENRQCLEALEHFGAAVDYSQELATFTPKVINRMLAMVKSEHTGWQRPQPRLDREMGLGIGGCCPFVFDDTLGQKRRANEADCINMLKVVETSPAANSGPPVYNSDCHPKFEPIRCLQLGLETFNKTLLSGIDLFYPEQIPFAVELGRLYRDDPCWFLPAGNCPSSPLTVGKTIADLAVAKAPYKKFYAVPTMPVAGANAPMTPAGTAVIGIAEILGGYILAKALNPETPVGACALTAKMDMKTGQVIYTAPEVFTADLGIVEVFEVFLKLPCNTFGVYVDADSPGLQAVREKLLRSLGLGLYGFLTGFEGTLDKGRVFSATQLMIDHDLHQFLTAFTTPPEMSDDDLGLQTIFDAGWDNNVYMTHEHTLTHMRQAWQSTLFPPTGLNESQLLTQAREKWNNNLKQYAPPDHPAEFTRDLQNICQKAKAVLTQS